MNNNKNYKEMFERVLDALKSYVEDDLEVTATSYVLSKLQNSLTDEELEEFGFGYLLEENAETSEEDSDSRWTEDESSDDTSSESTEYLDLDDEEEEKEEADADDEDESSYWETALMM